MRKIKNQIKEQFPWLIDPIRQIKAVWRRSESMEEHFTRSYQTHWFGGTESHSGIGSGMEATRYIRDDLPGIVADLDARSFLDIPCGDYYWMKSIDLGVDSYIGADLPQIIIDDNRRQFPDVRFDKIDITTDVLPTVDIIFCRDLFVHFKYTNIWEAIANIKKSHSKYLMTTTFVLHETNEDLILTGTWRPLNLEHPPFNFPKANQYLYEDGPESDNAQRSKSLGVWRIADL